MGVKNNGHIFKRIGFWNNGVEYGEYIWPQELVSPRPITHREEIASYLSNGIVAMRWMGYSGCRICGATLGTTCLTDGTWIWPEKLEHYVLEHNVQLPEEFVSYAEFNNWKRPKVGRIYETRVKAPEEFWIDWCFKHRNLDLQPQIQEYRLPETSEDFKLSIKMIEQMFLTVERGDVCVSHIRLPSKEIILVDEHWKSCVDFDEKTDEPTHMWTAKFEFKPGDFVTVYSDQFSIATILIVTDGKPYLYCGREVSMYSGTNIETRFCPQVLLHVYNPKEWVADLVASYEVKRIEKGVS